MKYNPLRLQKKFDNINTNKNKFMTLKEAINYAKTQQPNGLRPLNKQRFTNANTRTPFDRLNISEYLNMARQKRGIVKNSNVALANKQSKQVHRTPGKLSPNRGAFLKTLPVHKTYNAAQNGAQVKKNHNGTLNNANKNFKVSVANKQSKQVHLAPGKLSPNRGAFLKATLPVAKSYNAAKNGAQVKKNHNSTLRNANRNFKVSVANKQSKQVHLAPGKLSPNRGAFLTATLPVAKSYNAAKNGTQVKKNQNGTLKNANKNFKVSVANKQSKQVHLAPGKLSPNRGAFLKATLPVAKSYNAAKNGAQVKKNHNSTLRNANRNFKVSVANKQSKQVHLAPGKLSPNRGAFLTATLPVTKSYNAVSSIKQSQSRFQENITAATLRNKVHAYNLHKRTSGLTSQTFKENITAAKNKDKSNKRDKLHKALNNLINQYIL